MSFIDKTNIVIKKNNNDLYYFDIDKDIVLTKINNKNDILLKGIIPKGEGKDPLRNADNRIPHNIHQILVDEKISYLFTYPPIIDIEDNEEINEKVKG